MSDIDTVLVDSLKALDPGRPIREADIAGFDRPDEEVVREPPAASILAKANMLAPTNVGFRG